MTDVSITLGEGETVSRTKEGDPIRATTIDCSPFQKSEGAGG